MRKFAFKTENGQIKITQPDQFRAACLSIGTGQIVVDRIRRERTKPQNAYYWGVVIAIVAEYTGYYSEDLHDTFKARWLGYYDETLKMMRFKSTTDLDTFEFNEYIEKIRHWAAEFLGLDIPDPE